jgi:pimeloyl-ACP methyl ester carboxylesterase
MPIARVNGVELYYEETGQGTPLVWSHEFGGDHRSWEPQVRYFSRRYQVITYNHRGYPPSSVPKAAGDFSQDLLVEDLHQFVRHLGLGPVHLGGCSMGANVARDHAIAHPETIRSLIMVGAGAGSFNREQFLEGQRATAAALDRDGTPRACATSRPFPRARRSGARTRAGSPSSCASRPSTTSRPARTSCVRS